MLHGLVTLAGPRPTVGACDLWCGIAARVPRWRETWRQAARDAGVTLGAEPATEPGAGALTYGSRTVASSTPVSTSAFPTKRAAARYAGDDQRRSVRAMRKPQEIEDEEYEQVLQRVAAVDVAKKAGIVSTSRRCAPRG